MKEILESLLGAINNIDGGCAPCIREFIESANDDIRKFGYEFYDAKKDGEYWPSISVRDIVD